MENGVKCGFMAKCFGDQGRDETLEGRGGREEGREVLSGNRLLVSGKRSGGWSSEGQCW